MWLRPWCKPLSVHNVVCCRAGKPCYKSDGKYWQMSDKNLVYNILVMSLWTSTQYTQNDNQKLLISLPKCCFELLWPSTLSFWPPNLKHSSVSHNASSVQVRWKSVTFQDIVSTMFQDAHTDRWERSRSDSNCIVPRVRTIVPSYYRIGR